jgi:hypothetical protein
LTKLVEAGLGVSVRLMVRNVWMNQTLEVDGSRVPLVIELLDDGFVLLRAQGPRPSVVDGRRLHLNSPNSESGRCFVR